MPALPPAVGPLDHVEHRAVAGDDGRHAAREGGAGLALAPRLLAGRRAEQLEGAADRIVEILGLDGAQIGLVGPEQLVVRVADPEGIGDIVEQHRHRAQVAARGGKLRLRLQQLRPVAGHVPQAQDRAPADGAALHVDEAVAECSARSGERPGPAA